MRQRCIKQFQIDKFLKDIVVYLKALHLNGISAHDFTSRELNSVYLSRNMCIWSLRWTHSVYLCLKLKTLVLQELIYTTLWWMDDWIGMGGQVNSDG